jgi:poly(A) polymerase
MDTESKKISCRQVRALFSAELFQYLSAIATRQPRGIYLAGGTVRDLLLGREPADVDLTVACHARAWAGELSRVTGGAYVALGRDEDAARVVWQGEIIDFSSFRAGATTIDHELAKRDVTINGLGLCIDSLFDGSRCGEEEELTVIDPLGGVQDLDCGVIRLCASQSIVDDPLRMLRVFRFAATLGFAIHPETFAEIRRQRERITRVAAERVAHELDLIMATERAYSAFAQMAATGLLFEVIPELQAGVGMEQPASHHLDVYEHLMETLQQMERIQQEPGVYFPENRNVVEAWLQEGSHRQQLKWAAFLHDIGKPATVGINEDKGGRITFYNHDLQGADIFSAFARRLRWARDDINTVAALIAAHMRPFFLANNARVNTLTLKACLRLVRKVGDLLPGLFMLAMADALAGKGEGSPKEIEQEVAGLFERLQQVEKEHVAPVREASPLITGRDLIQELRLVPGPMFRTILEQVEEAQMEHRISTRKEALSLAAEHAGAAGMKP